MAGYSIVTSAAGKISGGGTIGGGGRSGRSGRSGGGATGSGGFCFLGSCLPRRARFAGFEGAVTSSSGTAVAFRLLRVRADIAVSERAELGLVGLSQSGLRHTRTFPPVARLGQAFHREQVEQASTGSRGPLGFIQ